jgi:hypothetical protein
VYRHPLFLAFLRGVLGGVRGLGVSAVGVGRILAILSDSEGDLGGWAGFDVDFDVKMGASHLI